MRYGGRSGNGTFIGWKVGFLYSVMLMLIVCTLSVKVPL